jgi:hypothetical protein
LYFIQGFFFILNQITIPIPISIVPQLSSVNF